MTTQYLIIYSLSAILVTIFNKLHFQRKRWSGLWDNKFWGHKVWNIFYVSCCPKRHTGRVSGRTLLDDLGWHVVPLLQSPRCVRLGCWPGVRNRLRATEGSRSPTSHLPGGTAWPSALSYTASGLSSCEDTHRRTALMHLGNTEILKVFCELVKSCTCRAACFPRWPTWCGRTKLKANENVRVMEGSEQQGLFQWHSS